MTIRLMRLPELTSTLGIGKVSVWSSIEIEAWMKRLAIQQSIE